MPSNVISGTVTSAVTVNYAPYNGLLTIAPTGVVISSLGEAIHIDPGTLINEGSVIGGPNSPGVYALGAANINNSGIIYGPAFGVLCDASDLELINTGTISAGATNSAGVHLYQGSVNNGASGHIYGALDGLEFYTATAVLTNYGSIGGGAARGYGVQFYAGGSVTNAGTITGFDAVDFGGSGTLLNTGTIHGTNGIYFENGGTLINAGTVSGSSAAVFFANGIHGPNGGVVIAKPGAVFQGAVIAGATLHNRLELAAGSMAGTLDMGGSFSGFGTIVIDAGAHWTLEGTAAELAAGQTITGFDAGDRLVLEGFTATSSIVSGNKITLSNGSTAKTLNVSLADPSLHFAFSDIAAGTEIVTVCYARGTRILTLRGEVAVEELGLGEHVVTRFGGARAVKWIGRQYFCQPFLGRQAERLPVRIQAGALGEGLPLRDLCVSPGHSLLLGEVLVLAKHLVNGVTIRQDEVDEVAYFNIELAAHDCVLAEGVWAETYADAPGLRAQFYNAAEFRALYPDHGEAQMLTLCAPRPEAGAALEAALLPVAALAAAGVAAGTLRGFVDIVQESGLILGWAQDMAHPELPVLLAFEHQGQLIGTALACQYRADVAAAGYGSGRCGFAFQAPAGARVMIRRVADGAVLARLCDAQSRQAAA